MKKIFTKAILLFIVVLGATLHQAAATNYTTVAGTSPYYWYTSTNWVGNNAPPFIIPLGDTVFVNHRRFIGNFLDVQCDGVIIVSTTGEIEIQDSLVISDGGVLINNGNIENGDAVYPIAVIINDGIIINNDTILNKTNAKFLNRLGAKVENYSVFIQNSSAPIMDQFGSMFNCDNGSNFIINKAGMINDGLLNLKVGSTTRINDGAIISNNTMLASGSIFNDDSLINSVYYVQAGYLNNTALVKNTGSFIVNGDVLNSGIMTNQGVMDFYGYVITDAFGELNNIGNPNTMINNYGFMFNKGTINNSQTFTNEIGGQILNGFTGEIINTFSGIFKNKDRIHNSGNIVNSGFMQNDIWSSFSNKPAGNILINATANSFFECNGVLTNDGVINNFSYFTNFANALLENNNILTNESTGNFTNYGEFNNLNDFTNNGYITNVLDGTFNNTAYFTSLSGTIANNGEILNTGAAEFRNYDIMNLNQGSRLQNSALLVNVAGSTTALEDTLQNSTTGTFIANGTMNILTFGALLNSGSMSIGNFGVVNNNWDMINNRKINNIGLINNLTLGYLYNNDTILSTGTLTNDGSIYTDANAYIQKDILGTGTLSAGNAGFGQLVIDNPAQDFNGQELKIGIGASNNYDKIITTGTAALDGANINVLLSGYTPMPNDAFTIVDATSFTTTMPTVNLPFIPNPSLSWLPPTYTNGKLVIQISSAPLNVLDVNFFATLNIENSALLNWQVVNTTDMAYFEIEHSMDGITFYKIGTINATEDKVTYQYIDKQTVIGTNYYRIKIFDNNKVVSYSKLEKVNIQTHNTNIIVYPNPAINEIDINGIDATASLEILDMNGKIVLTKNSNVNTINIEVLASGTYQIKIMDKGMISYHKITKQ
jgi:hypothetical protein